MDSSIEFTPPFGYLVVTPGLESLADAQLVRLGFRTECEPGGVRFLPPKGMSLPVGLALANLHSRVGSRVLLVVSKARTRDFAALQRHARKVDWSQFYGSAMRVGFSVSAKKSRLYHTGAITERLQDIIPGASPLAGNSVVVPPRLTVYVRLVRDVMTLSLDTSGEHLHRRGYRQYTSKAPVRETLAAAALLTCGWDAATPLLDPMCGSGTFLIEGALMAQGRPPGAMRRFSLDDWDTAWSEAVVSARRALKVGDDAEKTLPDLVGIDHSARAVEAARKNVDLAKVPVQVLEADAEDAAPTEGPAGLIIANPPYGRRISGQAEAVHKLCRLHDRFKGWRLGVLTPQRMPEDFESHWMVSNGGIRVRLWTRG